MTPAGLPHSEIPGSTVVCTSPRLIAACHVLHRFPEPRHPPYALLCLTSISSSPRAPACTPARLARPLRKPARSRRPNRSRSTYRPARLAGNLVSTNSLGAPCQRTSGSPLPIRHAPHSLRNRQLPLRRQRPAHRGPHAAFNSRTPSNPARAPSAGGEYRARTGDLLLAKQALSQLS
jgi:hypothetical protein